MRDKADLHCQVFSKQIKSTKKMLLFQNGLICRLQIKDVLKYASVAK